MCMLYKIRCQCMLHAVLWSGWYTHFIPRCRTSQYHRTFILLSASFRNDFAESFRQFHLTAWNWRVSRDGPVPFYWPKLLYPYYSLVLFSPFSSFCIPVGIVGLGSLDWLGVDESLWAVHCWPLLIIIIIIKGILTILYEFAHNIIQFHQTTLW